jgi:NADH-quinone oxidoreductase subunit L
MSMVEISVFSTLFGFLVAGLWGRSLGVGLTNFITITAMAVSTAASAWLFYDVAVLGHPQTHILAPWIQTAGLDIAWALRLDALSTVMMLVITSVALMVHVYAVGYMHHDASPQRFMAYLNLFVFCMMMLVTADNLVQLFFGWEGVGLASYLLIGFWHEKPSANAAAMKAFVVNRVGDLGLALGIFAVYLHFGTVQFDALFAALPSVAGQVVSFAGASLPVYDFLALLLFVGAVGKSAQLGLHVWLPDAMEGPTPVSALIHAATMVTAGVFLMCRVSPLLELAPLAQQVILLVGMATALFAATVGMTQFDIKRVIAYSTCSQLGYMMMAVGVGAYPAAMFHLFTHAFFKALLFLGAGSVIHALSHEQDMRMMGGLRTVIPWTYRMMLVGTLALSGIFPFAGYYSKDIVLESLFASQGSLAYLTYGVGAFVAFLTAFYSWRVIFLTFHGKPRADEKVMAHAHESPAVMIVPLLVLSLGAIGAGYMGYEAFVGHDRGAFWQGTLAVSQAHDIIEAAHHVPAWVKWFPLEVAAFGIALSWFLYRYNPALRRRLVDGLGAVYRFVYNKWYVDELYHFLFVRPSRALGRFFSSGVDAGVIDAFGPHGAVALSQSLGARLSRFQTGQLPFYGAVLFAGASVVMLYVIVRGVGV